MIEINLFDELFLSTSIQGWIGPIALVVASLLLTKKDKSLGIFFILLNSLVLYYYSTLISSNGWYLWNMIIMLLGVITCMLRMASN